MELQYQALLEKWLKIVWTALALISILAAYALEDQTIAWKVCLAAGLVASAVAVPDWPIYSRHKVVFLGVEVQKESLKKAVSGS
jgi:hypothetical protein